MEAVINTVVDLLARLWACASLHTAYMCYERNLKELQDEVEDLKATRDDMKRRVDAAKSQNRTILKRVETWLSKVGDVEVEVDELVASGTKEIENNCVGSCCPKNCWLRYKIGSEIEAKSKDVEKLKQKGEKFDKVVEEDTFDKVLCCFEKDRIGVVGLYGKGGVGKTMYLNQLADSVISSRPDFDHVIWVVVSQDLNPEKIQDDIAKEIGYLEERWKGQKPEEKAKEIYNVLSEKKFVLLLDDVWEPVNIEQLGVPRPDSENHSKVFFTTRSEDVCNQMGAEEKIDVGCLPWEKAWKLFQEKIGDAALNIHPEIHDLAQSIAKMCNGLPLALITIARAMSNKRTLQEWSHAVKILRSSTSEPSSSENQVFALLKFGYDSLANETIKSCFLYCTLFPEEYSINKSNLIDYWIGEGFLGEYSDPREARNEGYKILRALVDAFLLQDKGQEVKMHDLIREMALWIAADRGKVKEKYLVQAGMQLKEAPEMSKWDDVRRVSLMSNHMHGLNISPRSDKLLTLFLGNNYLKMITNAFFQFMPSLRTLDLSGNRELTELPPAFLKLVALQHLNLSRTSITQLPVEIKNLVNLKCLNLEHTYKLSTIPLQVISNFSNLNVLRMFHCASSDRAIGDGIQHGGADSLAQDLQHLQHLSLLTITFRSMHSLQTFENYSMFQACTQSLSLFQFRHSVSLDISFLEGMKILQDLEFIDCINLKELKIDDMLIRTKKCFNSLRKVSVVNCSKLKNLTWLVLAPNLEFLMVSRCANMEEIICQGEIREGDFNMLTKLEALQLVSLPMLKSIYPVALTFPCLKEIIVDGCSKLQKLPLNSDSVRDHKIVIQGWEEWWRMLEWEDEATRIAFLHSFKACMY